MLAARFRREIEEYQRYYKQQKVNEVKLSYQFAPLVYLTLFAHASNRIYQVFIDIILEKEHSIAIDL